MLLSNEKLNLLVDESNKLIADPQYRSGEMYLVLNDLANELICVSKKKYWKFPVEVKDQLVLDAITKCYIKIPRFNFDKASAKRIEKGYEVDYPKSIYRYVEVIIVTSFLSTLEVVIRKNIKTESIDTIGYKKRHDDDGGCELASLSFDDIDARIDSERAEKRAIEFEARLDLIEKNQKKGK